MQVRRPGKRRQTKVIDDDDDYEMEDATTQNNNGKMIMTETAPTPKRLQSEMTSTTHKDNHDDHDIDGSVKSIEHALPKNNIGNITADGKNKSLSNLIMPMSFD